MALEPTAALRMSPPHPGASVRALAWADASCGTTPGSPPCSFLSALHVLDILAILLGAVLLIVLAVTIHVFRKNRRAEREDQAPRRRSDGDPR